MPPPCGKVCQRSGTLFGTGFEQGKRNKVSHGDAPTQEPPGFRGFAQKWGIGVSWNGVVEVVVSDICGGKCGMEMLSKALGISVELSKSSLRSAGDMGGMCSRERKSQSEFWELLRV